MMKRKIQKTHKKKKRHFLLGLLMFLSFLSVGITAYGEEVPISVKPILPDNQRTRDAGFYDLLMAPEQEQTLQFEITNRSDEDVTLNLAINPASTGDNGVINYTDLKEKVDDSMKYPITELVTVDKSVSIPPNQQVKIPIEIKMPKETIPGQILGGIRVTQADEEKADKKDEGITITNKFAYVIAIQLQMNEEPVKETLALKSVRAAQVAGRNTVKAQLQNPSPTLIDEVSYRASITQKGKTEVLHQNAVEGYRIAPNTNFNFPISWENERYKAGTYTIHLQAESKVSQEKWDFEQEFTITAEEAKQLNDQAVGLEDEIPWLLYIGIGSSILLLLIIVVILLIIRSKNKKRIALEQAALRKKKRKKRPVVPEKKRK
ncbi:MULTISPECIES: DUF916 and DUF3324 domain-containing protein [unclassified Enterococcus]|uniref:DUF916 and DUF3324 domain-containing protein n=1 Tax=unclassified Enterococcus TaxID=2608891 RepID=UPI001CE048A9|nr:MULTISPECIES: DUF916 and DUF3324 domain-containing protein [unclassified Enterococcus]MCA5011472.1 DUF916 and DUF3324 domain-containing protein [Enterococcus sp. S23]MCA5015086.1 DUF916 and DUF3324 domain-containing protein [Enterococcus sp. S22(2020)]